MRDHQPENVTKVYLTLDGLDIKYDSINHKPLFTVEEAAAIDGQINGIPCKNLLITDKHGNYFLAFLQDTKRLDLKKLQQLVRCKHLSFASEEDLFRILGLTKGSVSPFGIINDINNEVLLVIDNDFYEHKLLFHPNINASTISIHFDDLIKFINHENHKYIFYK